MTYDTFQEKLRYSALGLCILLLVLLAGDYLVLRYRVAAWGLDEATTKLTVFDAAVLKNGRVNIYYNLPQTVTCARSIFPWLGYDPCWYARRHPVDVLN
jgi:hypothetical protein